MVSRGCMQGLSMVCLQWMCFFLFFTLPGYGVMLLQCNYSLQWDVFVKREELSRSENPKTYHPSFWNNWNISKAKAFQNLSSPSRYNGKISIHAMALKGRRHSASIISFQLSVQETWMWTLWKLQRREHEVKGMCACGCLVLKWAVLRRPVHPQVSKQLNFGSTHIL